MKTFPTLLILTGVLLATLATLACSHSDAKSEAKSEGKALPKVAVSLVGQGAPEGGAWVAATLQSTRTATLSTKSETLVSVIVLPSADLTTNCLLFMELFLCDKIYKHMCRFGDRRAKTP